jgi:hypothetical protein
MVRISILFMRFLLAACGRDHESAGRPYTRRHALWTFVPFDEEDESPFVGLL